MSKTKSKAPVGASLVVLSSFFYASYGIWTKLMGNFFDGYTASAYRSMLVVAFLLPIAIRLRKLESLRLKQNWPWMTGMIIGGFFTWGPLYYAILHAGIGISLAITYASIVIGMFLFGWLFAGERFTKTKAASALLGIAGLALIFSPTGHRLGWLALTGALVSGLSSAAGTVFAKQIHYNGTQATLVLWVCSIVSNFAMAVIFSKSWPQATWHAEWLYLIMFAIASVIASWAFIEGLKLIEAGAAGILGLLEIVFGVLFGVAFFHEHLNRSVLAGIAAIIVAAAIPYFKNFSLKRGTLDAD